MHTPPATDCDLSGETSTAKQVSLRAVSVVWISFKRLVGDFKGAKKYATVNLKRQLKL